MSTRTAYHWHPESRVFVATSEELVSPLEPGVFYPPGDATFDPPPAVPAGQRAVRNASNTAWVLEPIPEEPAESSPEPADQWAARRAEARRALRATDVTILRCAEAGVAVPAAWRTYRTALRTIASAETGNPDEPLPTQPAYPPGT